MLAPIDNRLTRNKRSVRALLLAVLLLSLCWVLRVAFANSGSSALWSLTTRNPIVQSSSNRGRPNIVWMRGGLNGNNVADKSWFPWTKTVTTRFDLLAIQADGKIAFERRGSSGNDGIWVTDADGSNQIRLTASRDYNPAWSPDGTKIAFVHNQDGIYSIYVMNADGSNQTNLTNNVVYSEAPAWSPDGTKIALVSGGGSSSSDDIYSMDADGSNQTRLTNNGGQSADNANPAWSPDGSKIAFSSARDYSREIYVMDADGSNQTRLTNNVFDDADPAWSPDGEKIAFTSDRDCIDTSNGNYYPCGHYEVYVMDANGSNQTRLTNNGAVENSPSWSADGAKIVFNRANQIYVMDADGSNQTQLTFNSDVNDNPDWQRKAAIPTPTPTPTPAPTPPASGFTIASPAEGSLVPCGQPITVTWIGGDPSANVNLLLIDQQEFSVFQGFGLGPNTGSRVVTIGPGSCGRTSRFYIEDSPRTTWIYGPVFNVMPTPTCLPPPSGLVSWWPGEGNADDIQDGNNGTLQNGVTFAPGKVGQAFSFDGIDDYVSVPDSGNLHFGTGDFTVSFWVNFNDLQNNGNGLVHKDNYGGPAGYRGWLFNICNDCAGGGGIGLETRNIAQGVDTNARYATSNFQTGKWYQIAGVRQSNVLYLYVDGVLRATVAESSPTDLSNDTELNIGSLSSGSRQFLSGMMDEVQIYNRALSSTEISAISNACPNTPTPTPTPTPASSCTPTISGLVSYWRAEGDPNDSIGSNSGTLQNGVTFDDAGEAGQAFSFDGNAYVQAPTNGLPTGNSDRTLSAWIKVNQFSNVESFFAGYGNFGSLGETYQLGTNGSTLYFSQWGAAIFGPSLQSGVWYHVAATNVGNAVTLYLNGQPVSTGTLTINTPSSTQFYIGRIAGSIGDTRRLNGLVDEIAVFGRALTAAEIQSMYAAGSAGLCQPNPTPTPTPTPQADLSINESASPAGNVSTSAQITYTLTVLNNGPSAAANVSVSDPIPAGTTFSSVTTSVGSCTAPSAGSTGTVSCSLGTINSASSATITLKVDVTALPGATINNTATVSSSTADPNPNNNSASASNQVSGCNLVVMNTNDDGAGSLRLAVQCANANPGLDTITFNISGADVHTIAPLSVLPTITDPVIIDGTTQPGFAGLPLIELNGSGAGFASGFYIAADNTTIRGLVINRFSDHGLWIGSNNVRVEGNYVGTNLDGTAVLPVSHSGIFLQGSNCVIGGTTPAARNIISGNGHQGIALNGSGNTIEGNYIGTNAAGTAALGGGGISVFPGVSNNLVGGPSGPTPPLTCSGACNLISGNNGPLSISTGATNNSVEGNFIGLNAAGTTTIPNNAPGVVFSGVSGNHIIGNVISGNNGPGVGLWESDPTTLVGSNNNDLRGNFIGTNSAGTAALPNTGGGIGLHGGSSGNQIGGTNAADRNVISGNNGDGINLGSYAGATSNNVVVGNYIGTNAAGTAALSNTGNGVGIFGSSNNRIGGTDPGAGNLISGNGNGVSIGCGVVGSSCVASTGNVLQGNLIGTDASGLNGLPNTGFGVSINGGSTGNTVGGPTIQARNIISGNRYDNISISNWGGTSNDNVVQGNYIGINAGGDVALNNGASGVTVFGSSNCTISGNVISGHPNGLEVGLGSASTAQGLPQIPATNNTVQGNYIGTNAAGTTSIRNGGGVNISASSGNLIGGTTAASRNVIAASSCHGVSLSSGANGNFVQGNYIGTNAAGTVAIPVQCSGVWISDSQNNLIGGTASGAGNLISGNAHQGVAISGNAQNNRVQGNLIGTDVTGNNKLGGGGVALFNGASGNLIGGTEAGARNIISGNRNGISLGDLGGVSSFGNTVQGNYIGTNASGTSAVPNDSAVNVSNSYNNLIGGTTAGAGNLISGNNSSGISLSNGASGNSVQGNLIGTNASGNAALGNSGSGVDMNNAFNNIVGGTTPAARNVISGNVNLPNGTGHGVVIGGSNAKGNLVQGNYIGTDATGLIKLGNGRGGVFIFNGASNNTVGGSTAAPGVAPGNLLSGNPADGISIQGVSQGASGPFLAATNNSVLGNLIGTNVTATSALANGLTGIRLSGNNNSIGGVSPAERNVISGNGAQGLLISGTGNLVQGNYIGTAVDGISNLGNSAAGVVVQASNNMIGGTANGAGNVIAYNGGVAGVRVSAGTGNTILSNSIFSNLPLGIDLGGDGVTLNTPCGPHTGPNNFQNFPVLTSVSSSGGNTAITGLLNSLPGTRFYIEFFSNSTGNPSGFGQGQTLIGSTQVMTDGNCNASFNVNFPVTISGGQVVTATATDPGGNTSEFSSWGTNTTVSSNNNPSTYGQSVTFTAMVTTGSNAVKDGSVTFREGATVLSGPTTVDANGQASFSTSSLSKGSHTIMAMYNSASYSPSSGQMTQTVNQAATTTSVTSSKNPSTYGDSLSFTVSISPSTATGTVQFQIDGNNFGSPVTVLNGSATSASTSSLTAGNHSVTAVYSGDPNFIGTTDALSGGQTVNRAPLTVKAYDKLKVYGSANPPLTVSYTGFVNGENVSALGGTLNLSTAAASSPVGSYAITVGGLTSSNYAITFVNGTLTVTKAVLTITADNKSRIYNSANPLLSFTPSGFVNGDTVATAFTGAPVLTTTALTNSNVGVYPITATIGTLNSANYSFMFVVGALTINQAPTTTATDSQFLANNVAGTLTATLLDISSLPIVGRSLTLTLGAGAGAQICSATTDATGKASCQINPVLQPLGPETVSGAFAGDQNYLASASSAPTLIFAYPAGAAGGDFVIGDRNAMVGSQVAFWSAQWASLNSLSAGAPPSSFKGFANSTTTKPPVCGGAWSSDTGSSSAPPSSVPAYIAVMVSSSITQSGSTIAGNIPQIVIVKTDAGYDPNTGHAGTGTVVAVVCH
jgi:uncharacterized repeat protein (TIGR01451 family)